MTERMIDVSIDPDNNPDSRTVDEIEQGQSYEGPLDSLLDAAEINGQSEETTTARRISLSGLRKSLSRAEKIDDDREQKANPEKVSGISNSRLASTGARSAVNLRIESIYKQKSDTNESITIPHGRDRRTYNRNARYIEKTNRRRERAHGPAETPSIYVPANRPMDNASANRLASKEVSIRSQEAYEELLLLAQINESISYHMLRDTFPEDSSLTSPMTHFTMNRLVRDGIVNEEGQVLKSPDELTEIMKFSERQSTAEEAVAEDPEKERQVYLAYGRSEKILESLIANDPSLQSDVKRLTDTRQQIWRDMSFMVPEDDRSELFVRLKELQAAADSAKAEAIATQAATEATAAAERAARSPQALYNEAEKITKLRVSEDTSDHSDEKKFSFHQRKVWQEIAQLVPEDERVALLEGFERIRDTPKPSAAENAYEELLKTVPNA